MFRSFSIILAANANALSSLLPVLQIIKRARYAKLTGMKLHWQPAYFYSSLGIFLIELFLALSVRDTFFRPFVGDVLAVILLYCFFKSFMDGADRLLALLVWGFACLLEVGQYLKILDRLGWQDQHLLRIVLGATFDWLDILAYSLGFGLIAAWIWLHSLNK